MSRFTGTYTPDWKHIAKRVKEEAGWKCVRCGHAHDGASGHTLTVHHLDNDKSNIRWWNLVPLCQRCHLSIQSRVHLPRPWILPHSEWFKPYVAGYYASIHGLPDHKPYVLAHVEELIAMGQGVTA